MAAFLGHVFRVATGFLFSLSLSLWNVDTCLSNDGFFFLFLSLSLFRSIAKNNLVNYYMFGDSLDTILSSEMPVAPLLASLRSVIIFDEN